ncbi:MAG: lytic transglycosylase domain-containing protein [Bacteroidetes bacterium]|jgi:membrane-bound lytic murein transglycosylase D|uniref:lytic transglycosylase domain-containing protein n=1 Tax=Daejeonella sp. TaxID=2805397 RepID=UPI00404AD215|nr:lytic transglycosylase domain-containing protein [Bacteroidota bacterium]
MIRKHIITCSGMLGILLTAKLFIFGTPADFDTFLNINLEPQKSINAVETYFNSLSFADENLPLGDQRIKTKMDASLRAHSYQKLRTSKLHNQAEKWFPIIEPILKKYGVPADFKYMPLVESGLKSGTSPKGASGYWQFMPQTARDFGLRVNSEMDERHNMQRSTIAAAKYLKSLYHEFGSWTLAAAAYNIGEGGLRKQISRQNQDNYFKMKLNRETASYVYKLISMKEIIENPTRHGYNGRASRLLAKNVIYKEENFPFETQNSYKSPQIFKN